MTALFSPFKGYFKLCFSSIIALSTLACSSGSSEQNTLTSATLSNPNIARIYFNEGQTSTEYTLHVWNTEACSGYQSDDTEWNYGLEPAGRDPDYGLYWDIPIEADASCVNFTPHSFDPTYQTSHLKLIFAKSPSAGAKVGYVFKDTNRVFYTPSKTLPKSSIALQGAKAHWITPSLILLPIETDQAQLVIAPKGGMSVNEQEDLIEGASITLALVETNEDSWKQQYPHLATQFKAYQIQHKESEHSIDHLIRGQIWVASYNQGDKDASNLSKLQSVTRVQTASLLDALYAEQTKDLQFGAVFNSETNTTTFRVWAPTAQQVKLIPFNQQMQADTPILMRRDYASGSWFVEYANLGHGDFYRYQVTLFHPSSAKIETVSVTDPYSLSLSTNSQHSQVVDVNHPRLKPAGWDELRAPIAQKNPVSFMIYETHIRDFSALDLSTIEAHRGKYLAFTDNNSLPVKHLKSLSRRGASHLHLLPVFDIATINEEITEIADINQPFKTLCQTNPQLLRHADFSLYCESSLTGIQVLQQLKNKDSSTTPLVQDLTGIIANNDSYNWGYDPFHYSTPEGSYATSANGMQRILEFRTMVAAIKSDIKMNVVMDVVYNHTHAAGLADKSVLDKIVPNYYHRLHPTTGEVEQSTCCANTAPERAMMEKLITDSILVWTKDYKIDAFRWDLMGHHPRSQILASLDAAKAINPDVYFYGEGWDFGEVANDKMFKQASQLNLYGTGIGSFSDRMRDAVRGGSPFDQSTQLRASQGFGNGAFVYPNEQNALSETQAKHLADLVRLGMAGNLRDYPMQDSKNRSITGAGLDYNNQPAGYAKDAWETINYVEKHDNQTLWDNLQYKAPFDADLNTRIRMHAVSLATVMYGQNVVFHHMGSELLRSKSMQRDSYNSGDWYNKVDFTKQSNNWNIGLPSADKDKSNWQTIESIYENTQGKVELSTRDMIKTERYFKEMMEIRASSPLFTLGDGREIIQRVKFHNTGSKQIPGLIIMSIDNRAPFENIDSERQRLLIVINARNDLQTINQLDMSQFKLHRYHQQLGPFSLSQGTELTDNIAIIPAWTAAIFEQR
ncbi:pullulanase [Vibrio halioticoli NBRC 102217]|uniref:Pullulanase n=1 Tax=Vibrio halioticoli NBRC 102217 TaxID=1219072 RepID=V5FJ40_9VIBR|nr:pullulanase-type alpha-1,6-glucosidase [Vibrio halioticoli]GAD89816.1 pullulanase [Vibrio halioticoli NBRC 102217]